MSYKIGIIGTGMLGHAVAEHLLDEGVELFIYNRTRAKALDLANKGANILDTPKEVAAKSDLTIIIVKDADAVRDVAFGKDGIIHGVHQGLVVADMSTISPIDSKSNAKRFLESNLIMLDTPVMGGPNVAITGDLIVMGAGPKDEFERFRPAFQKIGKKVFYLGQTGNAHAVKLAMNLQITMLALSLSEGLILVEKLGIKPETFLEILNSTYFKTGMSEKKAYDMIKGDVKPTFTLSNLRKDISTICKTAQNVDLDLPMMQKAEEVYRLAESKGFADFDYTGIITYLKKNEK